MTHRVVFVTYDQPHWVSGPNTQLQLMLEALRQRGFDMRVMIHCPSAQHLNMAQFCQKHNFEHVLLPHPVFTVVGVRRIIAHLSRWQKEGWTVDAFVPRLSWQGLIAIEHLKRCGVTCLCTLHSDDPYYEAVQRQFVYGPASRRVQAVVPVSSFLYQRVMEHPPTHVRVQQINNGPRVPDTPTQPPAETLRLVYSGRIVDEQKRITDTTEALCRASREIAGVRADLFGSGPEEAAVRQIIEKHHAEERVQLRGAIPPQAMRETLLESHVLVLLSDYEGLPNAVLEAMAAGVVPICMKIRSGITELICDGENGLLVEDRGENFIEAVRRLRTEPGLWARLSAAARQTIIDEYSNDIACDRWTQLLHDMIVQHGPTRRITVPWWIHLPPYESAVGKQDRRILELPGILWRRLMRKTVG